MTPSHRPSTPGRVVAIFGEKTNPRFVVEKDSAVSVESDDEEAGRPTSFIIRDADDFVTYALATSRLSNIDPSSRSADLDIKVNSHLQDEAYQMTVRDFRGALSAMMESAGVETAYFADTNITKASLSQIATRATNEVVEFKLAEAA